MIKPKLKDPPKMRVAWICHFSNHEVQSILHPNFYEGEFAPWITNLAKLFENDSEIELHILSPDNQLSGYKHFTLNNIHYHFFNPHVILFGKSLGKFHMNYRTNFIYLKFVIGRIINHIKPDIIHLHGAEVDHSSSIFQFRNKYPILITIQGFASHATRRDNYFIKYRINIEKKIFRRFYHFGYRTQTMGRDIKKYSPQSVLHWHHYPIPPIKIERVEKEFDLVFFARVTKDKGIEDLLECLSLIKKTIPEISLCIIGGTNNTYLQHLAKIANNLNISNNIKWIGFVQNHLEMFKIAESARISVLPTHHDIISGTIIESMFLKLPVVAYNVGSIHEINETGEFVHLIEKGDIMAMANKIISLLNNPQKLSEIGEMAYNRVLEMFDNKQIHSDVTNAYKQVIEDYITSKK